MEGDDKLNMGMIQGQNQGVEPRCSSRGVTYQANLSRVLIFKEKVVTTLQGT